MSRQASPENWTELINDFKTSGQSMATWCYNNNLKVHQLTYRLQKAKETTANKTTSWLPVDLNGDTALTIKIGPYAVIIKDDFDPVLLKKIVLTLASL
jgi:hypothetical protein